MFPLFKSILPSLCIHECSRVSVRGSPCSRTAQQSLAQHGNMRSKETEPNNPGSAAVETNTLHQFLMRLHPLGLPVLRCQQGDCLLPRMPATGGSWIFGADAQDAHARAKAHGVKARLRADDPHVRWAREVLRDEMRRGSVTDALHSLQGHPLSGEQWTNS